MPSLLVYSIVYLLLFAGCIYAKMQFRTRNVLPSRNVVLWACVIIVSVFIGHRWMVGVDYPNYLEVIRYGTKSFELDRFEPIPKLLVLIIEWNNLPYCLWFIIMAFLQFAGLIILVNKRLVFIFGWILLLYLTYFFEPSLNLIRQVAACIYALCAYNYISERKLIPFLLFSGIAVMFHTSAVIIIPFYWFAHKDWFKYKWLQFAIIIVCCLLGGRVVDFISEFILNQYEELKYVSYLDRDLAIEQGSGFGIILTYVRYIILVIYSSELKREYSGKGFNVFYNLTFVDMCIYSSIVSNQMVSRAMMFFTMADIVASAFLIHYLLFKRKDSLSKIAVVLIVSILAVVSLHNALIGEPWQFK